MPKQTPLQAAAAKADDAQTKKKARGAIAFLASLVGLGGEQATAPAARMSKRTETTKHTIVEEDDGDGEEEEESGPPMSSEEEEEESAGSSMPSTEKSSAAQSEEEEEEEESGPPASEEEEEEKAIAKAWAAAEKAYAKAAKGVDAYGVFGPKGARKALSKATGKTSIKGALATMSQNRKRAAKGDAEVIKAQADLAARVQKVESDNRKTRVDAMVNDAKAAGKAPTKALRAQLRAHGNEHGTKALAALIASLPVVARTNASQPKIDGHGNPVGAPAADVQALEKSMFGHLPEKERAEAIKEYRALYAKKYGANGAEGDA